MKILGPNDTGKGILIEWDAGYVNPNDSRNAEVIKESYGQLDHSKPFEFYAVLQKYDTPNRNGRVYPEKILRREAERYEGAINKGLSISELNHPESSLIDLDRVSHLITDMWWEGNTLMGKLKLLTSPGFHNGGVVSCPGDQAAKLNETRCLLWEYLLVVLVHWHVRVKETKFRKILNLSVLTLYRHHLHQVRIYSLIRTTKTNTKRTWKKKKDPNLKQD